VGLTFAVVGFIAGSVMFERSAQIQNLKWQLTQARAEIQALRQDKSSISSQMSLASPAPPVTAPPTNTGPTNNASELISEEDVRVALDMNQRSRKGEYILKFERPTDRKIMESAVREFAARMASNNAPELRNMFSKLGIAREKAQLLEAHVDKIMTASLQAEQAIQQLLFARSDYDQRVRSLLNDEAYTQYRQFEASKPAVREYDLLQAYASQNNAAVDPAYQEQLVGLIQQAQAYTELTWHGPYDGLPQVATGREMVANQLQQQIDQLSQAANWIKVNASKAGLPDTYVNLLGAYYSQSIQANKDTLNGLNDPPLPAPQAPVRR